MINWRFDQGRLDYFQFDEIKRSAKALAALDGIDKPASPNPDLLRNALKATSGLPFAPSHYYVWRNYKRVFGFQLLASEIGGRIYATDLCKRLAEEPCEIDVDDYIGHLGNHFYYPSPVFEGYTRVGPQIFPIVAILKYLLSEFITKNKNYASFAEIAALLIGNQVTGQEPIGEYAKLSDTGYRTNDDEGRQLRELVAFISQLSFLKWRKPNLHLELSSIADAHSIEQALRPITHPRQKDSGAEILALGSQYTETLTGTTIKSVDPTDLEFTEGKKVRVTHLRSERSAELKHLYFSSTSSPHVCRMCSVDTPKRYPWAQHVIELHHLLPLSSPIRVEKGKTSVKDLVGLCPTCHRATHKYYSAWLKRKKAFDFQSYEEAHAVFEEAKTKVVMP